MQRLLLFIFLIQFPLFVMAQEKPAYQIFDAKGKAVTFSKMVKALEKKDVVCFGELHNNPIAHWLQLELTLDLYQSHEGKIILGAEMFERDNQLLIDEYFADQVSQKNFESEVRLWNNYQTDYKPLLEFARDKKLRFVASNIPRRYANLVFRKGLPSLDSLPEASKAYIAPLPIEVDLELPSYQKMQEMMGGHGGSVNIVHAQAVKDATMAHSIARNFKKNHVFIHFNGSFHSDLHEGIVWYLKQYDSKLKTGTISTVEQDNPEELAEENKGKADFIIVVPSRMTKTY